MISMVLLKVSLTFLIVLLAIVVVDTGNSNTPAWIYIPGCICIFGAVLFAVGGAILFLWGL